MTNAQSLISSYREELRRIQSRHPFYSKGQPFWRECIRGRLELSDIRAWALDVYPLVRDFSRLYIAVASKCPDERTLTFLAETIFEETGSGVEAESHPTLFRGFMRSIGLEESGIPELPPTKAGRDCLEYCWKTVRDGSFLEGLALVGIGIERPLPGFFKVIAGAFRRRYGLESSALKYFAVHSVADVKHSQVAARIVSEQARTKEERESIRRVLFRLWDLQQQQLEVLGELSHK